jgi:glucokinase
MTGATSLIAKMSERARNVKLLECVDNTPMLLAGDVGGTKTLLGLFTAGAKRPSPGHVAEFVTLDFPGLEPMVRSFLDSEGVAPAQIEAACFGVAGAVTDQVAHLTNVPWRIACATMKDALGFTRAWVLNDLEALAYGVTVLEAHELAVLHEGRPSRRGNAAVLAAGTGLGQSVLLNVDGRLVPGASEGGHADFGARTPRELDLVRELTRVFGRVSVEHVLSGPGIVNLYQFTHHAFGPAAKHAGHTVTPARLCDAVGEVDDVADLPARITAAAADGRCPECVEAMDMFVSAYGAEAGNVALRAVATAGVYIGGGIAPKILPALQGQSFLDAFLAKSPMDELIQSIPVSVILKPDAGLLGAATYAQDLSQRS